MVLKRQVLVSILYATTFLNHLLVKEGLNRGLVKIVMERAKSLRLFLLVLNNNGQWKMVKKLTS